MSDLTRRRALLAVASGYATLAGCAGSNGDRATIERDVHGRTILEYDVRHVRASGPQPLFRLADEETATATPRMPARRYRFVTSAGEVAELQFADREPAEKLRQFATAADFETESTFLFSIAVEACHTVELERVSIDQNDHPHADFCKRLRPADVECSSATRDVVGYAIRLPIPGEDVNGSGSGMSSQCGLEPDGPPFDPTITVQGGNGS